MDELAHPRAGSYTSNSYTSNTWQHHVYVSPATGCPQDISTSTPPVTLFAPAVCFPGLKSRLLCCVVPASSGTVSVTLKNGTTVTKLTVSWLAVCTHNRQPQHEQQHQRMKKMRTTKITYSTTAAQSYMVQLRVDLWSCIMPG